MYISYVLPSNRVLPSNKSIEIGVYGEWTTSINIILIVTLLYLKSDIFEHLSLIN